MEADLDDSPDVSSEVRFHSTWYLAASLVRTVKVSSPSRRLNFQPNRARAVSRDVSVLLLFENS